MSSSSKSCLFACLLACLSVCLLCNLFRQRSPQFKTPRVGQNKDSMWWVILDHPGNCLTSVPRSVSFICKIHLSVTSLQFALCCSKYTKLFVKAYTCNAMFVAHVNGRCFITFFSSESCYKGIIFQWNRSLKENVLYKSVL